MGYKDMEEMGKLGQGMVGKGTVGKGRQGKDTEGQLRVETKRKVMKNRGGNSRKEKGRVGMGSVKGQERDRLSKVEKRMDGLEGQDRDG